MEQSIVIVVAAKDFKDEEYSEPKEILQNQGIIVRTASSALEEAIGTAGSRAAVDLAVHSINSQEFDGIIIVGGSGVTEYFADGDLFKIINEFNKAGKIVAAICWGPEVLAKAGVLNGKNATVWEGAKESLIAAGANYTASDVIVDGNIITSSGPAFATKFGQVVAGQLVN